MVKTNEPFTCHIALLPIIFTNANEQTVLSKIMLCQELWIFNNLLIYSTITHNITFIWYLYGWENSYSYYSSDPNLLKLCLIHYFWLIVSMHILWYHIFIRFLMKFRRSYSPQWNISDGLFACSLVYIDHRYGVEKFQGYL